MFIKRQGGKIIALIIYVDDIVVIENEVTEIKSLKLRLARKFEIKDLGQLRCFLRLKFVWFKKGIFISQRNNTLDLLQETGMMGVNLLILQLAQDKSSRKMMKIQSLMQVDIED